MRKTNLKENLGIKIKKNKGCERRREKKLKILLKIRKLKNKSK